MGQIEQQGGFTFMYKMVGLVKRRPDLTLEQFKDYWLNEHIKLEKESLQRNPIRKIVASFVTDEKLFGESAFDGMVELYFDTIEDMRELGLEPYNTGGTSALSHVISTWRGIRDWKK